MISEEMRRVYGALCVIGDGSPEYAAQLGIVEMYIDDIQAERDRSKAALKAADRFIAQYGGTEPDNVRKQIREALGPGRDGGGEG